MIQKVIAPDNGMTRLIRTQGARPVLSRPCLRNWHSSGNPAPAGPVGAAGRWLACKKQHPQKVPS